MSEPARGRVAVLGLARSGEAAARLLAARGATVVVLDRDDTPAQRERAARLGVEAILGRADAADLAGADLVVTSPGVAPHSPWIEAARARGIPVWSEVELAFRCGIAPSIAITGTNGKTTTTEMTVAALRASGIDAVAAGNVGAPLCDADPSKTIVAELSSFQLWGIESFRALVAVLLNVARDHLDWHLSFEAYAAAKARIFENQNAADTAVVHVAALEHAADAPSKKVRFAESLVPAGGAGVRSGWIVVPQGSVVEVDALLARGRPNRADAVAAAAAACALGADPVRAGNGLAAYRPQPHRVEHVATIGGVSYVNDSKATDPHATLAALEELAEVVLIAGGRNKGLDLGELAAGAGSLHAVVAIGEAAAEIEKAFRGTAVPVARAGRIEDAVMVARALARPGNTVLLSPACASFDMFDDYRGRGEAFRAAVLALRGGDR